MALELRKNEIDGLMRRFPTSVEHRKLLIDVMQCGQRVIAVEEE